MEGTPESEWPASAQKEPPTPESLFALMSGVEADTSIWVPSFSIDRRIEQTGQRLEELKDARAGVNAVRGNRWLDQLETDVLAGGAVGLASVVGAADEAVGSAKHALDAAEKTGDPKLFEHTRDTFVKTCLGQGAYEEVWPTLQNWLATSDKAAPKLHLVEWLAGQGRDQEAKQLAEGVLHENPRSFAAQNALAAVTAKPAEAQVAT